MIKTGSILAAVLMFALTGCATLGSLDLNKDGVTAAQGLEQVKEVVRVDLDAAIAISKGAGDVLAVNCFEHIKLAMGTPLPALDDVKGVLSTYAKGRAVRRYVEKNKGVSDAFKVACAPLIMDEQEFVLKMAKFLKGLSL